MSKMTTTQKLARVNADPNLWLRNFVKIVDNSGNMVPFQLNEQQCHFIEDMTKFNIILKARQLGFSTMSLGLCLWQAVNKPNTNYLIVSYKQDSSTSLFEKLKQMYYSMPHDKYEFPKVKRDNRGEFLFENGSRIQCVVAGLKELSRGSTYQYILLSEFAFYSNHEKILLAIEQSLAKNEESRVVIETTANGFNYFQSLFMSAYKGKSKYKFFFYPWFASAYNKQFAFEYEEAMTWWKTQNKGNKLYSKDLEPDEIALHTKGVTLKMITWRRWKLLDMTLQDFQQEFPSSPFEAFITSGFSVFDQTKIVAVIDNVIPSLPFAEMTLVIPQSLHKYVGKGLNVYHLPKRGKRYYAGVDTASGSGADDSAMSVLDDDGVQVAVFYSNKVPVHVFASVVNEIGKWYNYAFLVVERNSYGLPMLERLRKDYDYLNLFKHKQFDQRGKRKNQLGWLTTNVTKSAMITDFKEQFEEDMLLLNCLETLEQMRIFVDTDGRLANKRGDNNHDDCVIATSLAVQGIKCNKWYV